MDDDRLPPEADLRAALRLLGKENVLLIVHDASFPFSPGEDVGRGSPYSVEGTALLRHAKRLGFTGVQLGPQGRTSPGNASPYDSTLFSRDEPSIALGDLVTGEELGGLLSAASLERLVETREADAGRADLAGARAAIEAALAEAWRGFLEGRARGGKTLAASFRSFLREEAWWLGGDARVAAGLDPGVGLERSALERYAFPQFLLARQHARWRATLAGEGFLVWGDFQTGMSLADARRFRACFLEDYLLGAPPSRTNPAGQPWGYPVLDPERLTEDGTIETSGLRLLAARVQRLASEVDGVRVDHPHGLVCPWVYRRDDPDPYHAVRHGSRLFESPAVSEHPALARYARVREDQVRRDGAVPRYADDWVLEMDARQEERYAALLEVVTGGFPAGRVALEVLSTEPHPLRRVRGRLGLGRYRVVQKADPDDPGDVYRSENAEPRDWIMAGNHDTPSLWRIAHAEQGTAAAARRARFLAGRLAPGAGEATLARRLEADPSRRVHAMMSDLFASRATNAMVFFTDLFGQEEIYNRPGVVHPLNWTLRVPADWRRHAERAAAGRALDLGRVLADALRARPDLGTEGTQVLRRLEPSGPPRD